MFENDLELAPAIELYGVQILEFDFRENFCTERYVGNNTDDMYEIWKQELLTNILNIA